MNGATRQNLTAYSLAITTVTLERHDWFCRTFVTNRAAHAAAGEGRNYSGGHLPRRWWLTFTISENFFRSDRTTSDS
jgi:hypothetical protein